MVVYFVYSVTLAIVMHKSFDYEGAERPSASSICSLLSISSLVAPYCPGVFDTAEFESSVKLTTHSE